MRHREAHHAHHLAARVHGPSSRGATPKTRLSETVGTEDILEALRLIRSAPKTVAKDSQCRIDMNLPTEGTSATERKREDDMIKSMLKLCCIPAALRYGMFRNSTATGKEKSTRHFDG